MLEPKETRVDALGPEPFYLRVDECVYCEGEIMGVSGVVINPRKALDGYWCCCLLRNTDQRDFTTHCGELIVWIAQRKLEVLPEPYPKKALGDWVVPDKNAFCWAGYGTVAESVDWIKDVYERTMSSRELVRRQTQADSRNTAGND